MYSSVEVRYVKDMLRDKFYLFQHKYYFWINIAWGVFLYVLDPMAVVYAWLFPAMVLWNAGSSVLSLSHRGGEPHNDPVLGWVVWGEGWHRNHHDNPRSAMFNNRGDIGWRLIKLIERKYDVEK
jgi:stearoyl-CoA desaturase (delta-9 desaturase)